MCCSLIFSHITAYRSHLPPHSFGIWFSSAPSLIEAHTPIQGIRPTVFMTLASTPPPFLFSVSIRCSFLIPTGLHARFAQQTSSIPPLSSPFLFFPLSVSKWPPQKPFPFSYWIPCDPPLFFPFFYAELWSLSSSSSYARLPPLLFLL